MKQIIAIILVILLAGCTYRSGIMHISSVSGPYSNNMCNYDISDGQMFLVTIQDTCGKYSPGDTIIIAHKPQGTGIAPIGNNYRKWYWEVYIDDMHRKHSIPNELADKLQ